MRRLRSTVTSCVGYNAGMGEEGRPNAGSEHWVREVDPRRPGLSTFQSLFEKNYPKVRSILSTMTSPGMVVVAMDAGSMSIEGTLCVTAYKEKANSAVVGRHSSSDLFLFDSELSLRHLLLVVEPYVPDEQLRFRCVDLASRTGVHDELQRQVCSISANGAILLSCGRFVLFFLPNSMKDKWPDSAKTAWSAIPDRVFAKNSFRLNTDTHNATYLYESDGTVSENPSENTLVSLSGAALRSTGKWLGEGEKALGELVVVSEKKRQSFSVGGVGLDRGLLIGRSEDNDAEDEKILTDKSVSRVHAVVLSLKGDVYVVDSSSSNGTFVRKGNGAPRVRRESGAPPPKMVGQGAWDEVRTVLLRDGVEVYLGDGATTLTWNSAD